MANPKKIIIFGDFGIDDTIALFKAMFREDFEILGVVADYGNVPRNKVLRNLNFIQYISGRYDIPIFQGSYVPLTAIDPEFFPDVHGQEGLGPFNPQLPETGEFNTFPIEDLIPIIKMHYRDLTIVTFGRLSSLATTFILALDIMRQVKRIIMMGGAFFYPGNVTALSEANFYGDPYAANLVLRYATNVTVIPLNVTQNALITPAMADQINVFHQQTKDPLGLMVKPLLEFYQNFYSKNYPGIQGAPIHDAVTLFYLVNPDAFETRDLPVKVIVDRGNAFGQSFADFRYNPQKDLVVQKVAFNMNYEAFTQDFMSSFLRNRINEE
ncbi:nucleoside hydrolase [Peribacillus acanthi]|uniref:nucleoside hydrolase n=1 Tax=Peribacillus acanthi TaxID=2171554 RepID=UPI000D3E86EF|nr:nucleoside hydrolase [Peribacillus acanthi]